KPGGLPEAAPIVAGIGDPAGAVRVVLLGVGVVARALADRDLFPPAVRRLLGDVFHVDDARLELGQRSDVLDQVVAFAGRYLRRDPGGDLRHGDVVHRHVDPDLPTPLLDEGVEPFVVGGNEMAPQEYAELTGQGDGRLLERDLRSTHRRRRTWRTRRAGARRGVHPRTSPAGCESRHNEIAEKIPPSEPSELARIEGHHSLLVPTSRPNIHRRLATAPGRAGGLRAEAV